MVDEITVSCIDSKIINRDELIFSFIKKSTDKDKEILIYLNGEGPCAQSLGLYQLLDNLCTHLNFSKNNITIETSNLLEKHDEYKIKINFNFKYLKATKKLYVEKGDTGYKSFDKNFKHFGNIIGHSNQHRLDLASYLFNVYKSQSLQSYHTNLSDDYFKYHLGIEDLLHQSGIDSIDRISNLLKNSPLTLDYIKKYPILLPETLDVTRFYKSFFVEICCLSFFSGNVFYIDEKIWRAIAMKTPFIIQGPVNFLKNFKKLGFKTFDNWWSEQYSDKDFLTKDLETFETTQNIKKVIDYLATKSLSEIEHMYLEMQDILEHNYQRLLELEPWEIKIET